MKPKFINEVKWCKGVAYSFIRDNYSSSVMLNEVEVGLGAERAVHRYSLPGYVGIPTTVCIFSYLWYPLLGYVDET